MRFGKDFWADRQSVQDAFMKLKPIPTRTKGLLSLLVSLGFVFSVNAVHVFALENELDVIADEHMGEWRETPGGEPTNDVAALVTASKEYLVFGKVSGKIEVFVREDNRKSIAGIAYYYQRNDKEWILTESGACTDAECQVRGTAALADVE